MGVGVLWSEDVVKGRQREIQQNVPGLWKWRERLEVREEEESKR